MTLSKMILGCIICVFFSLSVVKSNDLMQRVKHGYVDNDGVKIHFVSIGKGPLVVMVHGFPDFWYTWRHQMEALFGQYQVVAIDLRGYNKSDKPKGIANYAMRFLIGDVAAVIKHFSQETATVVGHDWGGAIAWQVAMRRPELVDKLVILSTPHPNGLFREISVNPDQQRNSQYARDFQKEYAYKELTAEGLANWVQDEEARKLYIEVFQRSDFEAMLNYYKASFPRQGSTPAPNSSEVSMQTRKVKCPTLAVFGLQDEALLPSGWNDTWDWIENDLTLVSIPFAGHFILQDASELITRTIRTWLLMQISKSTSTDYD